MTEPAIEIEEATDEELSPDVVELSRPQKNGIKKRLREEHENNLADYIHTLTSGGVQIKTSVVRDRPKDWHGKDITGTIDSFHEPISVDDIRDMFGGGTYRLQFFIPGSTGSWEYVTCRTVKLAGDPKIQSDTEKPKNGAQNPDVVRDAMKMAHEVTIEERRRAERIEREARNYRDPSIDIVAGELAASRQQQAESQRVIYDMMNRRSDTSPADHLLGKMMDNESGRISQLRAQHESEIRMKSEMHRDELERIHQRYEQNAQWQQAAHQREVESLRMTLATQEKMLETSYRGQLRALERELEATRADLMQNKSEVSELRAKKDKGLVESLTEIATVKEALEGFGGGDKEDGSTIERIISGVMGSPLAEGVASRLAGGGAIAAAGAQPQPAPAPAVQDPNDLPINQPIQLPDGSVAVRRPDGRVVTLRPKRKPKPGEVPEIKLDPGEVQIAIQFMEAALANDTDPEQFAASARNVVPSDIIGALRLQGVDHFLIKVAKLPETSPLLSMHGKSWARKVAAILVGE
jgi:hypothetical protein